ncbi:acetate--CoA ligase family protein [Burkholderia contaminans]|nr:acetate--CoA ligase family protein [Burkholderia contaminans]
MDTFQDLSRLISPTSVALVGASDRSGSIGERALSNLLDHSDFKGSVYLINATKTEVAGRKAYPDVASLPEAPDTAVIAVPAEHVLNVLNQCADKGVRFAIILTSGFGEAGDEGKNAEQEMKAIVARSGMRIYGPNCPGLTNVTERLGFTFSPSYPHDLRSGPLGVATQGGGLGRNVMQAMDKGVGIALWSSSGNEVDLQVSDFINYMADAPDIKVIATLLEGINDGRKFVAAVQHAARKGKPVIALKVGRSEYGQKAAQSHTASLTGSAEVNSAVFAQLGVIEVDDIDELVDTAWLFTRGMPKVGGEVAIYTNSGGTAALCADMVGTVGLKLATFDPATRAILSSSLPPYAAIENPVDTTTAIMSNPELGRTCLRAVANDPNVAIVLLPNALEYGKISTDGAQIAVDVQSESQIPLLPIWMSERQGDAYKAYSNAGMSPIRSISKAVKAVKRWMDYAKWRESADLKFTALLQKTATQDEGCATRALSEPEAKTLLRASGIACPESRVAATLDEARTVAGQVGYPLVAKIVSAQIQHKSDVGGVVVGIRNEAELESAWNRIQTSVKQNRPDATIDGILLERMAPAGGLETLIGVSRDPVFGHVLTFGLGGIYVEIFKDVSRRMLPLSEAEADAMMREVQCFPLLDGARGKTKRDLKALRSLLVSVSDFVVKHADSLVEMDLNPVWVGNEGEGALPLDAVVVMSEGNAK